MTVPTIIALDLSLNATGIACNQAGGWATTLRPGNLTGYERLDHVRRSVFALIPDGDVYAVVESPAFMATGNTYHQLAGQWWLMTYSLFKRDIPTAFVNPRTLKSYTTGKGAATKDEMLAEVSGRFPRFMGDHNAADALALCAMGCDHFGVTLGAYGFPNPGALAKVTWPDPQGVLSS